MDTSTGLVRDNYDPHRHNGVLIPARFLTSAQACASAGIPLHDERNTDTELREWAKKHMTKRLEIDSLGGMEEEAPVARPRRFNYAAAVQRQNEANAQRKAEIKRRRKLQKQRGVR